MAYEHSKMIVEFLESHFPDECDVAGPTNVGDVAEGVTEFVRTKYAAKLDLTQVLMILAGVSAFLNDSISVYKVLKEKFGRPPQKQELAETVESTAVQPYQVEATVKEKVYIYVLVSMENKE